MVFDASAWAAIMVSSAADGLAAPLQPGAHLTVVPDGRYVERQDFQRGQEHFQRLAAARQDGDFIVCTTAAGEQPLCLGVAQYEQQMLARYRRRRTYRARGDGGRILTGLEKH